MDAAGGKPAPATQDAALVEPGGDGLHAHRPPFGARSHVEDHPHDAGFGLVDHKHFLVLVPAPLSDLDTVAIGRARTVPEALPGILQHGAVDVFSGLPALMLVEDVEQFAKHLAGRVLPNLLRDRDQFNPGFPQLADIEFRMERVAAEPAEGMHNHQIERFIRPLGGVDHFLKDRSVLIEGRSPRF
ncbi:MAG: hypothetical protein M0R03_04745 [Novosphingobium sp.]|nr:hypothetical protein [Novosphingobium sp.]